MLVIASLVRTAVGPARRHPDAPFVAAAVLGFLAVGAFDSLLDVPRVAFVFYLVLLTGLLLRPPRPPRVAFKPSAAVATEPVAAAVDPDVAAREAAARAERRRNAFGKRHR